MRKRKNGNCVKGVKENCIYFMGKKYNCDEIRLGNIYKRPLFPDGSTLAYYVMVDNEELYHDLQEINRGKTFEEIRFNKLIDEINLFVNDYGIDIFDVSINKCNGEKEIGVQTSKHYLKK